MSSTKYLAVNVFTPSEEVTPPETKAQTPAPTSPTTQQNNTIQTTDTSHTGIQSTPNEAPMYVIYAAAFIGLLVLLALFVIIRKLNKKS